MNYKLVEEIIAAAELDAILKMDARWAEERHLDPEEIKGSNVYQLSATLVNDTLNITRASKLHDAEDAAIKDLILAPLKTIRVAPKHVGDGDGDGTRIDTYELSLTATNPDGEEVNLKELGGKYGVYEISEPGKNQKFWAREQMDEVTSGLLYNEVEDGEKYISSWQAQGYDVTGNLVLITMEFVQVKGEEDEPENLPWRDEPARVEILEYAGEDK